MQDLFTVRTGNIMDLADEMRSNTASLTKGDIEHMLRQMARDASRLLIMLNRGELDNRLASRKPRNCQ